MQIVVLLAFITALSLVERDSEMFGWKIAVLSVCAYWAAAWLLAMGHRIYTVRCLNKLSHGPAPVKNPGRKIAILQRACLIAGNCAVLWYGWGYIISNDLHAWNVPLAAELLGLMPFVVALFLTWMAEYPIHSALRNLADRTSAPGQPPAPSWTLGQFLAFNARHYLLFIAVPICLIVFLMDSIFIFVAPVVVSRFGEFAEAILAVGAFASIAMVFVFVPIILVRVWKTSDLPAGELRAGLEQICVMLRLKFRRILIWHSGSVITNAAVLGAIARARYVLLSDGILEQMDDDEIRAVFGHEAGHVISRHIPYMVLFVFSASMISASIAGFVLLAMDGLAIGGGIYEEISLAFLYAPMLAGWVIVFGIVSRAFERQSDVIGAWIAGLAADELDNALATGVGGKVLNSLGAAVFAQALEKVAILNAMPLTQPNWRHGSIQKRVDFILTAGSGNQTIKKINTPVRWLKAIIWLMFAIGITTVILTATMMTGT